MLATGDLSVDNRRYLAALRAAAAAASGAAVAGSVTAVADDDSGRVRVRLSGELTELAARHVVIAAGRATRPSTACRTQIRTAIRPVKGQILRLRHPAGSVPGHAAPHRHTIRAIVQGPDLYLVPRADGELVVGATQEERDDRDVTAGAVHDLLRDAMTAVPAVSELILAEASAGLRPGTSDNGPILGSRARPPGGHDASRLIIATGHFRNGILLSAVTADAVAALLAGDEAARRLGPLPAEQVLMTVTAASPSTGDPRELPPGITLEDLVSELDRVPEGSRRRRQRRGRAAPRVAGHRARRRDPRSRS